MHTASSDAGLIAPTSSSSSSSASLEQAVSEAHAAGKTQDHASHAPIGVFDSGLGGLSVLRALRAQMPDEAIIYAADSLYAPYGERDDDFIADRTLAIGQWLVKQGAKVLVVACNTATAQSIALVRERLDNSADRGRAGYQTRRLAIENPRGWRARHPGNAAQRPLSDPARALRCRLPLSLGQPGHGLVQAIERCDVGSAELRALLNSYLQPMLDAGADTLVLGCTHYPFLDAAIRDIVGDRMTLIDTSVAIARQVEART
jgi:glutamate racemase